MNAEGDARVTFVEHRIEVGKHHGTALRGVGQCNLPHGFIHNIMNDFIGFFFHIYHLMGSRQIDPAGNGGDHLAFFSFKERHAKLFLQF